MRQRDTRVAYCDSRSHLYKHANNPHLTPHPQYPRLLDHVDRQAQGYLQLVAYI